MSRPTSTVLGVAQLLLGSASLLRPVETVRILTRGHGTAPDPRIVRVLGARQVAQGVATLARPDVLPAGAVVDGLHAASLVPLIVFNRRYRRAAATSAALAGIAAAVGLAGARASA